jgi:hypothetical protein
MTGLFNSNPNVTESAEQFLFIIPEDFKNIEKLFHIKNFLGRKVFCRRVVDKVTLRFDHTVMSEIAFN